MDRTEFETVLQEALEELPREFAQRIGNVAILVEDEPSPELLRSLGMHPRRDLLFGLYQGTPLDQRGATYGNALPDTIHIYIEPHVRTCRSTDQLRREIRKTLIHELGHFFGLPEKEIRRLGY